jgi:hypothetical protein
MTNIPLWSAVDFVSARAGEPVAAPLLPEYASPRMSAYFQQEVLARMVARAWPGARVEERGETMTEKPAISLEEFTGELLGKWFAAPAEISADCTYACPKACAARAAYEATTKQGKGTILVMCEDQGQVKAVMSHLVAWFLDVPALTKTMANQRADEI